MIASLPFDAFREAMSQDLYLESGDKPTLFQQGRFYKFFKELGKALADPAPTSAPTSSGTTQSIVLSLQDTNNRTPFKDVLDQTMSGTFTLLSEKEISELRKNYVTARRQCRCSRKVFSQFQAFRRLRALQIERAVWKTIGVPSLLSHPISCIAHLVAAMGPLVSHHLLGADDVLLHQRARSQ